MPLVGAIFVCFLLELKHFGTPLAIGPDNFLLPGGGNQTHRQHPQVPAVSDSARR